MNIREYRLAKELSQPQVVAALQKADPRLKVPDLSRYENGVSLPTPSQLVILCQVLDANPNDLYTKDEIELAGCLKTLPVSRANQAKAAKDYKLTVRLPESLARGLLTKVRTLGYEGITAWITEAVINLKGEQ